MKKCKCGCGRITSVAKQNNQRIGWIKGQHIDFINGHWPRFRHGENHPNWKGGKTVRWNREYTMCPPHKRADMHGYVQTSILVAEEKLGFPLPEGTQVHHIDGNKRNDDPINLLVLENNRCHMRIHRWQRAYAACGHAQWRKCKYCRKYDDPKNMYIAPDRIRGYHKDCKNEYERKRCAKKTAERWAI
jgi:hypothetical protein